MFADMELKLWETNALERNYEVTRGDLVKNKALIHGAWLSPILLASVPALITFLFGFFTTNPVLIFLSLFLLIGGFIFGLIVSGSLLIYRQRWLGRIREQIAVDGIKTEEVQWFKHELTGAERKALRELESQNRLLGDAYRETLASRLTATRIVKNTKNELNLLKRREGKLKNLKSEASADLQKTLRDDRAKLEEIRKEAEQMRIEAETRLQLIEAASRRGTNVADTEFALKKLTARSIELPLALEALKMEEEIRREIEAGEEKLLETPAADELETSTQAKN
jgi:hypothetical protein